MEKRNYVKPILSGEEFVPQNYIAACGDSNSQYIFNCNAKSGKLYYYPSGDGEIDGKYEGTKSPVYLGDYSECPTSHTTTATDVFYDGFIDNNKNGKNDLGDTGVIVYLTRHWGYVSGHATEELDMKSWETAKS